MMASTNSEENDHERPSKRQDTGRDKDEKLTKLATGAEWKRMSLSKDTHSLLQ